MAWLPKTLADEEGGNAVHQCACGRRVPADMLVDVGALDTKLRRVVRGGGLHSKAPAAKYLCDGCRDRLVRTGRLTRAALATALGAPKAMVQKQALKDNRG